MGAATPAGEAIARNGVKLKGFAGSVAPLAVGANGIAWPSALHAGMSHLPSIQAAQRLPPTGVGKQAVSFEAGYLHGTLYLKGRGESRKRLVPANDDSRSVIPK